jgi:uncharacterized protein (TIGR02466 family)
LCEEDSETLVLVIQSLFPIPIYSKKLNLNVAKMAKYCLDVKKKNPGIELSNVGGWHSPPLKGKQAPLKDLFNSILHAGEEYREAIQYRYPLRISPIWININEYKDYNQEHMHPNCVASGVYYIQAESGDLVLNHPIGNLMEYDWPHSRLKSQNCYNSPKWDIPPANNQLFIFPGWLSHTVKPNLSKKNRISISFNFIR